MRRCTPWMRMLGVTLGGCAVLPGRVDLTDEPFDEAIAQALDRLEATYAFTEHKQLDWQAARDTLLPLAEMATTAEQQDDVIRRLVPLMPDAHVRLSHTDSARPICPQARGSLGVVLSDLDDGRVIIAASDNVVLQPGDEVLSWASLPIEEARSSVSMQCFPIGAATHERQDWVALMLLTRAELDAEVAVQVLRDGTVVDVSLSASPDADDIKTAFRIGQPDALITHELLPENIGYISIGWEETYITERRFQPALVSFKDAKALVIDLRDNDGGMERTAANLAGYFAQERSFYETVSFLNNRTGEQETMSTVWSEPQEVYWGRPVAVLIDHDTVSSGEGLSMLLSRQTHVEMVGFEGTAASFGSTGSKLLLPGGWELEYPGGRSLDVHGNIQLDSDASYEGGVLPTVRVPWTQDLRIRHASGEDVVLQAAVTHLLEVTQ